MIGLDKIQTHWFGWERIGSVLFLAKFFLNGHVVIQSGRQNKSDNKFQDIKTSRHQDIVDWTIAVLLHFKSTLWWTFHLHSGTPLCVARTCTLLALLVINSIRFQWDLSMVAIKYMPTQFDEHGEVKNPLNVAVGWRQIHTREVSLHQQMLPHQSLSQWRGMSGDLWHSQHQV